MTEPVQAQRLTDEPSFRLRRDVFEALAAKRGADTIDQQADLTGVSRASLVRIRGGKSPSLRNAARIAQALGVEIHVLFKQTGADQ